MISLPLCPACWAAASSPIERSTAVTTDLRIECGTTHLKSFPRIARQWVRTLASDWWVPRRAGNTGSNGMTSARCSRKAAAPNSAMVTV
ncbi:hypothetical protein [Mycobacterium canetti]|uniref:hypothetical protein n=1 Tax=Mycobacterium canetti TaxID=78331 RepID=UPI00059B24B3|nr:hypothetical protein [Mycobacterium canetti]